MLRRLFKHTGASVLVEFAICFPVLLTLYIGSYTVADEIACNRKVAIASRTLTDLLSRGLSPTAIALNPSGTDATGYMSASVITLTPYAMGRATENVALLRICSPTQAYVVWSQAITQTDAGVTSVSTPLLTAPTAGATPAAANIVTLPTNMITSASYASTPLIPNTPTGICTNYSAPTGTLTAANAQVGTAGGYIYVSEIDYAYTPVYNFMFATTVPLSYVNYMSPRLN